MIAFQCPGCLNRFSVKDEFAGKKTKCPKCGFALTVPVTAVAAASVPASAPALDPLLDAPPLPPTPVPLNGTQRQTGLIIAFCVGGSLLILAVALLIIGLSGEVGSPKVEDSVEPPLDLFSARKKPEPRRLKLGGALDQFGNPQHRDAGLAQDGEFAGKKILVYGSFGAEDRFIYNNENPLWISLKKKGFEVTLIGGRVLPTHLLDDYDQLWIFCGSTLTLSPTDIDAIERAVRAGKGLYLLADNEPFYAEANAIASRLFGAQVRGNYQGTKIAYVAERGLGAEMIAKYGGQFSIGEHVLLTGVNFIYEGITISHFNETPTLKVAMRASDGNPVLGVADVKDWRVVVDCGFTRYFYDQSNPKGPQSFITRVAGTLRFGENVAAYLAGKG